MLLRLLRGRPLSGRSQALRPPASFRSVRDSRYKRTGVRKEGVSMSTQARSTLEQRMVFRKTNANKGRTMAVTPSNITNRHLVYGRVILDGSAPGASFRSLDRETCLICLSGHADLKTAAQTFHFGQYDSIYIPRDSQIEITTSGKV